ncbi:MAG TPA: hypothetical protein VGB49_08415 [Caulobacteraceae bacterium]|jgi:hypothetical protein
MVTPERSSRERLVELAKALDDHDRRHAPPAARVVRQPEHSVELGPKTTIALRALRWAARVYWVLWLALALIVSPPRDLGGLIVIPFSAIVCWLGYQWHKILLVWAVRKVAARR